MDDERRKQIEEEEHYRAEVRAKFEREDAAPAVEERPVKKKKRRGCLGNLAIAVLVIFALGVIANLLPETEDTRVSTPTRNDSQPATAQTSPEPTTESVSEPEPTPEQTQKVSALTLNDGSELDMFTVIGKCHSAIRDLAISPRSVKFRGFGEPILIGEEWVYTRETSWENAYGVRLEGTFICGIGKDGVPNVEAL